MSDVIQQEFDFSDHTSFYVPIKTPHSWKLTASSDPCDPPIDPDEMPVDENDYGCSAEETNTDLETVKDKSQDETIKRRITELTESLYDLHKNPNHDREEVQRLLDAYRLFTGKDKPRFML